MMPITGQMDFPHWCLLSGCNIVGSQRAVVVAQLVDRLWFESSRRKLLSNICLLLTVLKRRKQGKKRPFLKNEKL